MTTKDLQDPAPQADAHPFDPTEDYVAKVLLLRTAQAMVPAPAQAILLLTQELMRLRARKELA